MKNSYFSQSTPVTVLAIRVMAAICIAAAVILPFWILNDIPVGSWDADYEMYKQLANHDALMAFVGGMLSGVLMFGFARIVEAAELYVLGTGLYQDDEEDF